MRRRQRANLDPVTVRPPRRLTHPRASMTEEELTLALADWSAALQPHEHPPVILERLRVSSVTATVPLDWADQEREHRDARHAHLRELKALEARQHELLARSTAAVRRNTPPAVLWAS